jgi:multidrug resistance efflux pump
VIAGHTRRGRCYHDIVTKVVGRRRVDRHDPAALQRTLAAVRRTSALVPRGVYRFRTFEEADASMTRMMARTHASLSSKTLSDSDAR